ncbi:MULTISPECIES: phage minor head protein [unclassified Moraxella]|uniref:phage minor head protein n=1 Tax=unclassified Moraxella TaxID=2685852 RepID=UPI002B41499F|nr:MULTISPECIES: phage minor head protein [unclassified Moraxella]
MGVTLDELTKSFSKNESERLIRAIGFAHTDGLTNDKLIQMIRGSKANHFKDGILSTTSRNAQTIARTGTAIMASEAKQEFINQNRDIIKGIRVNATLDRRTSPICRHLDHQFMPIERAKYPPYHFNCRSGFEIVFDGYESPKNRASEFGVTENVSYYEWLKNQDKAYIQSVLGKKKAQTFLSDGMTADKFKQLGLDRSFEPLTLDEMVIVENNSKNMLQSTKNTGNQIVRTDWGDFPNAMIAHTKDTITTHSQYLTAKSGDIHSALRLVDEFLSDEFVVSVQKAIAGYPDIHILPVHAEEMLGRNKIPIAYALALSEILGVKMDLNIVQAKRAYRTDADGVGRLLKRVSFDGKVVANRHYMIVDDVITQGGTLADLRAYIENWGGKVVLASTLNGKPNSARIPITKATLGQLRKQAGKQIEQWWQEQFGYDFSKFTESEARYLAKQIHRHGIDTVRDTLFKTRP